MKTASDYAEWIDNETQRYDSEHIQKLKAAFFAECPYLNERDDDPNYVLFEPITVFAIHTILRPINEIENFNDMMNECFTTHPELMDSVDGVPFPPDTTHVIGYHGWHFPITPNTGQSEVKKIAQMICEIQSSE